MSASCSDFSSGVAVRGIGAMLAAVTLFSVMMAIGKVLTETYPLAEVMFFRNAFGILPPVLFLAFRRSWRDLGTRRLPGHLLRATIGTGAMALSFWSFHLLPLADATALSFSTPLFLTALSAPLLREKVGPALWGAVVVGFLGVLIIAKPSGDILNAGVLVAVAAAFAAALASIMLRQLGRTEPAVTTVFYFSLFAMLFAAPFLPAFWVTPDWKGAIALTAMGLIGGVAQQYLTLSYALMPAAALGPFSYVGIVFASLFGWLFWNDIPTVNVLEGTAIVIASGLFILVRETIGTGGGPRRIAPSDIPSPAEAGPISAAGSTTASSGPPV